MKKIVLDVDGVLLNFCKKYKDVAEKFLEKEIITDPSQYDLQLFLQISKEENHRVWNHFNAINAWSSIPPLPGVEEAIDKINSSGLKVYVVSSVNPAFTNARLENLSLIGLKPEKIYCVGDGNSHKHDYISQIEPVAFVDDRLDHLYRSLEVPHLAWIDNQQTQELEPFIQLSTRTGSLKEWVDINLDEILDPPIKNKRNKLR